MAARRKTTTPTPKLAVLTSGRDLFVFSSAARAAEWFEDNGYEPEEVTVYDLSSELDSLFGGSADVVQVQKAGTTFNDETPEDYDG